MINVLLIDVDESLQHLCKKYLERSSDLHVEMVQSVRDGEKLISKKKIDVIVADVYLPWMSGLEYLKKLRMRKDPIPFILFSGRVEEDVVIDALNSGVDYFILKGPNPISKLGDLEQMVRSAVHDHWREKANSLKTTAFDRAVVGNLMIDAHDRVLEVNEAALGLWKVEDRSKLVGKEIKDLLEHGDVIDVIKAGIDILGRWEGDFTAKRTDGTTFTAYAYVTSIKDETGKLFGHHVTLIDVTEKRACDESLKKSHENLRLIAENSTDWISMLDPFGGITYSSSAIKELTGHAPDDVVRMELFKLVPPEDVPAIKQAMGVMLDTGSAPPIEFRLRRKDGSLVNVEAKGRVVDVGNGQGLRVLMITRDVSCRPRQEQPAVPVIGPINEEKVILSDMNVVTKVEDLERLMDVMGHLELVKERAKDPWLLDRLAKMEELLGTVIDNANSVLEFQQIGTKEAEWQSVHDLLRDIIIRIDPDDVHVQVLAKRLEVLADPMLDRVFYSLIDNTMKHGGKAHKIWVAYEMEGSAVKIIFEDNGVGIPMDMKPRLFERRYGKHGLPLAHAVLAATGISICETGTPGKGARFEITVPNGKFRLR
ncbi:MAG: PAS domain S-box protein [Methanomassiliicoccales archaeon]|nr:MAG: PAS domain S-box protein [Methanomassiliicoccales archaeon]